MSASGLFFIAASKEKKIYPHELNVCLHSGGIYTGSVFISVHNETDLHLHSPERLQFSALGEERGVIEKSLLNGTHGACWKPSGPALAAAS